MSLLDFPSPLDTLPREEPVAKWEDVSRWRIYAIRDEYRTLAVVTGDIEHVLDVLDVVSANHDKVMACEPNTIGVRVHCTWMRLLAYFGLRS